MKFCPFLVAGQSLATAQAQAGAGKLSTTLPAFAAPAVDLILRDLDTSDTAAAAAAVAAEVAASGITLPVVAVRGCDHVAASRQCRVPW